MTDERPVPTVATEIPGDASAPTRSGERERRPWLAAVLSALWPGMGQLYSGRLRKAILWPLATIAWLFVGSLTFLFSRSIVVLALAVAAGVTLWLWCVLDAARAARKAESYRLVRYNRVLVYVAFALILQIVQSVGIEHLKTRWLRAFRIPSGSMHPTLQTGDYFFADMRTPSRDPAHGELLVVASPPRPDQQFVKRVIGVAGDRVEIRDKVVMRNGARLREPYAIFTDEMIRKAGFDARDNLGPLDVPPRSIWVLGDNRDNSNDSRYWGAVPRDFVLGRPFLIYWSWDAENGRVRSERIGRRLP